MRMRVSGDAPEAFERWVAAQRVTPPEPSGRAAEGKAIFTSRACVGCHAIRGVSAGVLGPDLPAFGSRRTLGAGLVPDTPAELAARGEDPGAVQPGRKMPGLGLDGGP